MSIEVVPFVLDESTIRMLEVSTLREYVAVGARTYKRIEWCYLEPISFLEPPPYIPDRIEERRYLYKPLPMSDQDAVDLVVAYLKPTPPMIDKYPFPKGINPNVTKLDNQPVIIVSLCRRSVTRMRTEIRNVYVRRDGSAYVRFGNEHVEANRPHEYAPYRVLHS